MVVIGLDLVPVDVDDGVLPGAPQRHPIDLVQEGPQPVPVDQARWHAHHEAPRPPVREIQMQVEATLHQRSEEHTSELQSLMRISYAVFCLKKKKITTKNIAPLSQHKNSFLLSSTLVKHTRPNIEIQ